jgi:predicted Zn-dependent protease
MAHFNAGTALARLGLPDLALAALDRAAALQPGLAEMAYWRGAALLELRRPAEARRALEEAARRNPMHPHVYPILARLCLEAGEMEQAQSHLATYRRHWPHVRERELEVQE